MRLTIQKVKIKNRGTSPVVQWLKLHASIAGDVGSIPGPGTKILHAKWCGKKKNRVKLCILWYVSSQCKVLLCGPFPTLWKVCGDMSALWQIGLTPPL